MLHLVCRIAEALCQLQNVGHTKYITWSLDFTCSKVTVEKLTDQAANMENELKDLLDSIKEQRLKSHALNYFTTQQLLQIRCELGNLKQDSTAEVTSQLYSLLSIISLHITSDDIKNVVEAVCFNEQEPIYEKQVSINEASEVQLPLATEVNEATEAMELEQNEHDGVTNECMDDQAKLKLAIESLSKEEENVFEQLQNVDFSEVVCYEAVKYVFSSDYDDKLEKAMEWCFKYSSQYENDDFTAASVSTDFSVTKNITDTNVEMFCKDTQLQTNKTPPKKDIDIKHVVVQQLIESNFTPEIALKGARMFDGNFDKAFEWCLKSESKSVEPQQLSFLSYSSVIPVSQVDVTVDTVK